MLKFLLLGTALVTAYAQVQVAQEDLVQVADPSLSDVQDGVQVALPDQVQIANPDGVQVANPDEGSFAYFGARRRRHISNKTPSQQIPSYDQQEEDWSQYQDPKHNLGQDGHGQLEFTGGRSDDVQGPARRFSGSNHLGVRNQQNRLNAIENLGQNGHGQYRNIYPTQAQHSSAHSNQQYQRPSTENNYMYTSYFRRK